MSVAGVPTIASPATYLKLIGTALVWGATWIAGRVAVSEAPPLAVASWRFLLAALVLGTLVVIHEGWPRWSLGEWLTLAALGASGIFLYNLCFLYGLKMIEAGRGALVVALTPAVVAVGSLLAGQRRSTWTPPASAKGTGMGSRGGHSSPCAGMSLWRMVMRNADLSRCGGGRGALSRC